MKAKTALCTSAGYDARKMEGVITLYLGGQLVWLRTGLVDDTDEAIGGRYDAAEALLAPTTFSFMEDLVGKPIGLYPTKGFESSLISGSQVGIAYLPYGQAVDDVPEKNWVPATLVAVAPAPLIPFVRDKGDEYGRLTNQMRVLESGFDLQSGEVRLRLLYKGSDPHANRIIHCSVRGRWNAAKEISELLLLGHIGELENFFSIHFGFIDGAAPDEVSIDPYQDDANSTYAIGFNMAKGGVQWFPVSLRWGGDGLETPPEAPEPASETDAFTA